MSENVNCIDCKWLIQELDTFKLRFIVLRFCSHPQGMMTIDKDEIMKCPDDCPLLNG